jgi:ribosome-associated protein
MTSEVLKISHKNSLAEAKAAGAAIDERLGKDIVALNISSVSTLADYFIIASAGSSSHLKALSDAVDKKMTEMGARLRHCEGVPASGWILMDFGGVVVHLLTDAQRVFYNLERIWGDAERVAL